MLGNQTIDILHYPQISATLDEFKDDLSSVVIGSAKGIGALVLEWCEENKIMYELCLPNYQKYGDKAPRLRDELLLTEVDFLLCFCDGFRVSHKHLLQYMIKHEKPYRVVHL